MLCFILLAFLRCLPIRFFIDKNGVVYSFAFVSCLFDVILVLPFHRIAHDSKSSFELPMLELIFLHISQR